MSFQLYKQIRHSCYDKATEQNKFDKAVRSVNQIIKEFELPNVNGDQISMIQTLEYFDNPALHLIRYTILYDLDGKQFRTYKFMINGGRYHITAEELSNCLFIEEYKMDYSAKGIPEDHPINDKLDRLPERAFGHHYMINWPKLHTLIAVINLDQENTKVFPNMMETLLLLDAEGNELNRFIYPVDRPEKEVVS